MKSPAEWFSLLPDPYRGAATKYAQERGVTRKFRNFKLALLFSFRWARTAEGYGFWRDVYEEPDKFLITPKSIQPKKLKIGDSVVLEKFADNKWQPWRAGDVWNVAENLVEVKIKKKWFWETERIWVRATGGEYKINLIETC